MISEAAKPGCGEPAPLHAESGVAVREFDFERDTFAYANELLCEYRFHAGACEVRMIKRVPPPSYAHHCFVMTRSARQFFCHASFDPRLPRIDARAYRGIIRKVISRSSRECSGPGEQIPIPGYTGLKDFSRDHEQALKLECGGRWASYFLRSHWRMVFPFSRIHQERMASQLVSKLRQERLPIVHLVRFPHVTINHGFLLFQARCEDGGIEFQAYDPNEPGHPVALKFERPTQSFMLSRNRYWIGGRVDVYEIFCKWPY